MRGQCLPPAEAQLDVVSGPDPLCSYGQWHCSYEWGSPCRACWCTWACQPVWEHACSWNCMCCGWCAWIHRLLTHVCWQLSNVLRSAPLAQAEKSAEQPAIISKAGQASNVHNSPSKAADLQPLSPAASPPADKGAVHKGTPVMHNMASHAHSHDWAVGAHQASLEDTHAADMQPHPECAICLDADASVVLQPCGHMCVCAGCAHVVADPGSLCPMCRREVLASIAVPL